MTETEANPRPVLLCKLSHVATGVEPDPGNLSWRIVYTDGALVVEREGVDAMGGPSWRPVEVEQADNIVSVALRLALGVDADDFVLSGGVAISLLGGGPPPWVSRLRGSLLAKGLVTTPPGDLYLAIEPLLTELVGLRRVIRSSDVPL